MKTFSASPAICAGNSPVTGEFPAQKPVTRSFDTFLANHRDAGDLRRHRAPYDVTVLGTSQALYTRFAFSQGYVPIWPIVVRITKLAPRQAFKQIH